MESHDLRIGSPDEFRRLLVDTIETVRILLSESPGFPPFENIILQLEAMLAWTNAGRSPTIDEKESIDVALIAVRELEDHPDPIMQALCNHLFALNSYFDSWK